MAKKLASSDEVKATFEKISNWGKWGKDDERGALNFITDQKRAAAARLVRTGRMVAMALPLPTRPAADNPSPVTHLMMMAGVDQSQRGMGGTADYFAISPHGFATTHLDALCHILWNGKMYNGFDGSEVGSLGARKCPIDVARHGVASRGVLLDIPKLKGVEWFEPGQAIFPEDLDAAEKQQGVRVEEGDVLLIRTGRTKRRIAKGGWEPPAHFMVDLPGLDAACLPWLHERKIAVLGSDATSDVIPSGYDEVVLPVHIGTLVFMGVHLIDNADFEALAGVCAELGRYEFQFVMGPLFLERGTASPVSPLAIF